MMDRLLYKLIQRNYIEGNMRILIDNNNPMATNGYMVIDDDKSAYIIDAPSSLSSFQKIIEEEQLDLKYILLTHGHYDHVLGLKELRSKYNAKIVAHRREEELLKDPNLNLSTIIGSSISVDADIYLEDQKGQFELFEYRLTPGHTKGSVTFIIDNYAFTGDLIFRDSIGRTDFPGGSFSELSKAVNESIFTLDDEAILLPGHGPKTQVAYERENNPFLK